MSTEPKTPMSAAAPMRYAAEDCCASCGKPWIEHKGLTITCHANKVLRSENAELRARLIERTEAQVAAGKRDQARYDGLMQILADPNAVRLNMIHGKIAWTPETLRSVLGDPQP